MTDPSTPDLTTPLGPDEWFVMEESPYDGTRLVATKDREDAENWHTTPRDGAYAAVDSRASVRRVRLLAPSSPGAREGWTAKGGEAWLIVRRAMERVLSRADSVMDRPRFDHMSAEIDAYASKCADEVAALYATPGVAPDGVAEVVAFLEGNRRIGYWMHDAEKRQEDIAYNDRLDRALAALQSASPASLGAPPVGEREDALFKLRRAIGGMVAKGGAWREWATEITRRLDALLAASPASLAEQWEPGREEMIQRAYNEAREVTDTRYENLTEKERWRVNLFADKLAALASSPPAPGNEALREAWERTSSGVLFDVAFSCLARSPMKEKVSVHDFRDLMLDVQESVKALGYEVGKSPAPGVRVTEAATWQDARNLAEWVLSLDNHDPKEHDGPDPVRVCARRILASPTAPAAEVTDVMVDGGLTALSRESAARQFCEGASAEDGYAIVRAVLTAALRGASDV